jgi:FixJ family two-component response regulator
MKSDSGKISIVDDDESIRTATRGLLRSVGYQVETFASAELFLESDALQETDCLVSSIVQSENSSLRFCPAGPDGGNVLERSVSSVPGISRGGAPWLFLDVRMPGIDGLELQRRLNAAQSHVPIIFVTAHDDKAHRTAAMDAGAANFFHKPFEANAFVTAIQMALRSRRSFESLAPKSADTAVAVRLEPS